MKFIKAIRNMNRAEEAGLRDRTYYWFRVSKRIARRAAQVRHNQNRFAERYSSGFPITSNPES